MIKYDKLYRALEAAGYNTTKIRESGITSQNAYNGIKRGESVNLTLTTIDKLCNLLHCQPWDLFEYVPDLAEDDRMPE